MRKFIIPAAILVTAFAINQVATTQDQSSIFDNPKNLKVLPEDISSRDLDRIMHEFTRELGAGCSSCHKGTEEMPNADRDFASDEKETKKIARKMLKMVDTINETITGLDRGADHKSVTVTCLTCHRGQQRPRMIEDILADAAVEGGADAAERGGRGGGELEHAN